MIKSVYFMNLTINNLIKGVQVAPFLACFVLARFDLRNGKNKKYGGIKRMTYDIKATINGQIVRRVAYGDLQAWLIINQLTRDGCKDICMSERKDSTAH